MTSRIRIFSTQSCKYCIKSKDFFAKINREFEEVKFEDNPVEFQAMADKVGAMTVPIVQIGETIIVGYNPNKFIEAL